MRLTFIGAGCAAALLSISACANGQVLGVGEDAYVVTSATPDAITLRFREGNLNKATARAEAHCKETYRTARMENVMPNDGFSLGSFRCV